jgi:hypothetical protein
MRLPSPHLLPCTAAHNMWHKHTQMQLLQGGSPTVARTAAEQTTPHAAAHYQHVALHVSAHHTVPYLEPTRLVFEQCQVQSTTTAYTQNGEGSPSSCLVHPGCALLPPATCPPSNCKPSGAACMAHWSYTTSQEPLPGPRPHARHSTASQVRSSCSCMEGRLVWRAEHQHVSRVCWGMVQHPSQPDRTCQGD